MEVAQGSGGGRGGALCAGASAGSAHRMCAGTYPEPGSAWARARVSGREFPRGVFELTCLQVRKGRGCLGVQVCVRLSEHIPVRSMGVSGPHQPPGLTWKIALRFCLSFLRMQEGEKVESENQTA